MFRRCGQYAMVAPLDAPAQPNSPSRPCWSPVTHERLWQHDQRDHDRRRRDGEGLPRRRRSARASRPRGSSTSRSSCPTRRRRRRPCSRRTKCRRRRSSSARSICRSPAASSARSSSTAAARTRARATSAWPTRARWRPRPPGSSAVPSEQVLVASTGVIGVNLPMDKLRSRHPAGVRGAVGVAGSTGRAGHHDHGSVPEGVVHDDHDRRQDRHDRRHGEGLRDDRPGHGHAARNDAGVRHDRRGGSAAAARAARSPKSSTTPSTRSPSTATRSTNDTVMLLANGASGATIGDAEYASFAKALRAVCLELALGIVRGGEGATKLVTVTVSGAASQRRGETHGEGHRQFPAREDGHSRRRPELGPAHCRRGTCRRRLQSEPGEGHHRTDRAVRERPAARRACLRRRRLSQAKRARDLRRPRRRQRDRPRCGPAT